MNLSIVEDRGNWWPESEQLDHRISVLVYDITGGRATGLQGLI